MTKQTTLPPHLLSGLTGGHVIPYFGPGVLDLIPNGAPVPSAPEALAAILTAKVAVPHKIRNRLTAASQFIENFKHRKTLVGLMNDAFKSKVTPSPLHAFIASLSSLPLWVDAWYDDAAQNALAERTDWGQVQGLSQSEHFGTWTGYYDDTGTPVTEADTAGWNTLLYKPIGGARPASNYLVSDTDYVEVLTEIDIQTPIPQKVQELRTGRHFLFLGCRFNDQLQRTFARQIMKRSSDHHWAVLPGALTRNELRFFEEQNIQHIDMPLQQFVALLTGEKLEVHV
jgi:hypothetical protein